MPTATAVTVAPVTSFAALWDELKTDALNLWQSVQGKAVAAEAKIVPVIEQDIMLVLSQFRSVATNMVMTLATAEFNNLTGAQKNTITAATIVSAAKAAGQSVLQQDAQMLAQQAYHAVATTLTPGS